MSLDQGKLSESRNKSLNKDLRSVRIELDKAAKQAEIARELAMEASAQIKAATESTTRKAKHRHLSEANSTLNKVNDSANSTRHHVSQAVHGSHAATRKLQEDFGGYPKYKFIDGIKYERVGFLKITRNAAISHAKQLGLREGTFKIVKIKRGENKGLFVLYSRIG